MVDASTRKPEDFVISTGRMETVRRFIEISAEKLGWGISSDKSPIIWEGEGVNEIGKRADTNEVVIRIDPRYFRPTEVDRFWRLFSIKKIRLETKNKSRGNDRRDDRER